MDTQRLTAESPNSAVRDPVFRLLIAALGGEGGSVLMNWIVAAARSSGLAVQATSVPGVAQRTGSTSYYIEMSRTAASANPSVKPAEPIFALVPMPGRVDVVLASEAVEAGRMMERGFVSGRTTLVYSTSRFLTTAEKSVRGDGRFEVGRVDAAARELAGHVIADDFDTIARSKGTLISAALFGAIAASGRLPLTADQCRASIGTATSATASRNGFEAAFAAVKRDEAGAGQSVIAASAASVIAASPIPKPIRDLGAERCRDYQDQRYADLYVSRIARLEAATEARDPETLHALEEAARRLALWMCYEDIPRVAELKTKPERFAEVRAEAEARPGQIVRISEYLKPGAEEVAAMLPVLWGRRLMARVAAGRRVPFTGRGITVTTTNVGGYLVLRSLASLKRFRRGSYRYAEEQANIEDWLGHMVRALGAGAQDPQARSYAASLAELPRVLKGYGDTHARGRTAYAKAVTEIVETAGEGGYGAAAARLRQAITNAVA